MQFEPYLQEFNFHEYAEFDTTLLTFSENIRDYCKQNTCGQFNKNHMCPPAVKDISAWEKEISTYQHAIIVTRVYPIKSSFDMRGMLECGEHFSNTLGRARKKISMDHPDRKYLFLGAGPCRVCGKCTILNGQPCRLPTEALPSIEACGIDVMSLSIKAGVKYNNGNNTVTYLGLILYQSQ